jgi:hypothetical protein
MSEIVEELKRVKYSAQCTFIFIKMSSVRPYSVLQLYVASSVVFLSIFCILGPYTIVSFHVLFIFLSIRSLFLICLMISYKRDNCLISLRFPKCPSFVYDLIRCNLQVCFYFWFLHRFPCVLLIFQPSVQYSDTDLAKVESISSLESFHSNKHPICCFSGLYIYSFIQHLNVNWLRSTTAGPLNKCLSADSLIGI